MSKLSTKAERELIEETARNIEIIYRAGHAKVNALWHIAQAWRAAKAEETPLVAEVAASYLRASGGLYNDPDVAVRLHAALDTFWRRERERFEAMSN